jgi:Pyridoxamine 5'-phosphate oxidase
MSDSPSAEHAAVPVASPLTAPAGYPFPQEAEGLLAWAHAERQLETARNYWLATTRPDGRPHVTPLWGVWLEGAFYCDGHPRTRWARNIAANPAVCLHLENGSDVVILEGVAEDVTTDVALGERIIAAWMAKYGRLAPDPAGSGMVRVRPEVGRGWSHDSLKDGARWRFGR